MNTTTASPIAVLPGTLPAANTGTAYERGRAAYLRGARIWQCESQEERDGWCACAADFRAMLASAVQR